MPQVFQFLNHPYPLAFAHRGAHLGCEENTWAAFAKAVQLGYRYIETDVQATRDGVPVLFHDDTLSRVLGISGAVSDYPWSELAQMRTPAGEPLLRLEDALTDLPRVRFNLDAKFEEAVEPLAEAIRRCNAVKRVCVGSFDARRTLRVRALLGENLCWSPSHEGVGGVWLAGWGLQVQQSTSPSCKSRRTSMASRSRLPALCGLRTLAAFKSMSGPLMTKRR